MAFLLPPSPAQTPCRFNPNTSAIAKAVLWVLLTPTLLPPLLFFLFFGALFRVTKPRLAGPSRGQSSFLTSPGHFTPAIGYRTLSPFGFSSCFLAFACPQTPWCARPFLTTARHSLSFCLFKQETPRTEHPFFTIVPELPLPLRRMD